LHKSRYQTMAQKRKTKNAGKTIKAQIKYEKSKDFKSALCTGAYGGVGQKGLINMYLFLDRMALPEKEVYKVDEKGHIIEIMEDERSAVVREVYFGALFDISTAKSLHTWLGEKIKNLEEMYKSEKK